MAEARPRLATARERARALPLGLAPSPALRGSSWLEAALLFARSHSASPEQCRPSRSSASSTQAQALGICYLASSTLLLSTRARLFLSRERGDPTTTRRRLHARAVVPRERPSQPLRLAFAGSTSSPAPLGCCAGPISALDVADDALPASQAGAVERCTSLSRAEAALGPLEAPTMRCITTRRIL